MNNNELNAIENSLDFSSKGNWIDRQNKNGDYILSSDENDKDICIIYDIHDAMFISHSKKFIKELIQEIKVLKEMNHILINTDYQCPLLSNYHCYKGYTHPYECEREHNINANVEECLLYASRKEAEEIVNNE